MVVFLQAVFGLSTFLLLFAYVGFPLLLAILARKFSTTHCIVVKSPESLRPSLTVVIAAYNAAAYIEARIRNLLDTDHPRDRIEILIASDGSSDETVKRAEGLQLPSVRVLDFRSRAGKAATLIRAIEEATGDILVFTDASTHFHRDSLSMLVRNFEDADVGIVSGHAKMVDRDGASAESAYWRMENQLRRWEAELGLLTGVSGALYAMRRSLFCAPSVPIINDDLVFPLLAWMHSRCRFVRDEQAIAEVLVAGDVKNEFRRRVRIGLGAFQSLHALRSLFQWRFAQNALAFGAHKVLRWFGPFLLLGMFISSMGLAASPLFFALWLSQVVAYALSTACLLLPDSLTRQKWFMPMRILSNFVVMNVAIFVGFLKWYRDPARVTWEPTHRASAALGPAPHVAKFDSTASSAPR